MRRAIVYAILVGVCLTSSTLRAQSAKINVAVSILPLAEFVEQVGGDRVNVTVMIPPGANPHAYEPVPSQMAGLSSAKLFVIVGSGLQFETLWMQKLRQLNPRMEVCDCSQGIALRDADSEKEHDQTHADHQAGGKDPHIWLSPINAQKMITTITQALIKINPQNKEFYQANAERFSAQLAALHQDITVQTAGLKRRAFMVFHPGWGYFADTYGLREVAIEQEGKEPSARQLAELITLARKENITTVLVSPQFSRASAETISRELGGVAVVVDDLAKDYIANLRRFARALNKGQQ